MREPENLTTPLASPLPAPSWWPLKSTDETVRLQTQKQTT